VPSQTHRDGDLLLLTEVIGRSHIVQRVQLQHEVTYLLWAGSSAEKGQRVVARITVEKYQCHMTNARAIPMNIITNTESKDISIEGNASLEIPCC